MIPNRIYVKDRVSPTSMVIGEVKKSDSCEVEFIRADKVMEVINRIGGASSVVKKSELIKEIEAL